LRAPPSGKPAGLLVAALATVLVAPAPANARARVPVPHISSVRCWPPRVCGATPHTVAPGGKLRFKGRNLKPGLLVLFPGGPKQRARAAALAPRLRRANGFQATVPSWAKSGRVRLARKRGRKSNGAGPITIKRPVVNRPKASGGGALAANGMWIWYVSKSNGGDPAAIAAQAKSHGVQTVFVKSSDGTTWWSQFSPTLVTALKAGGLHVCAWQFVYGTSPAGEAALGARAAQTGADCLVIDAESKYEGKYGQAQTYINALRAAIGPDYPLALSGFPYVDFHPAFPYSVFLGPGGAQYNLPQMYWKAIGTSVDQAFSHTYAWNTPYKRALFPLGQLYSDPSPSEVKRFRQLADLYGAGGVSWWSWQSASARGWDAIGTPLSPLAGPPPAVAYPTLKRGARGDLVLWVQEHLIAAGQSVATDGSFNAATETAVSNFQTARALLVTGQVDAATWDALLRYQPAAPNWGQAARASRVPRGPNGPRSAFMRARRDELRHVRRGG